MITDRMLALERSFSSLLRAHTALREKVDAIQEVLASAGLLSEVQVDVQIHRHNFALAKQRSDWSPEARLEDVMQDRLPAPCIQSYMQRQGMESLRTVSRDFVNMDSLFKKIYAFGGTGPDQSILNTAERFDPMTNSWEPLPTMGFGRSCHAAGIIGGLPYLCGGRGTGVGKSLVCYNPSSLTWRVMASMGTPRYNHAATVLGGKLYVTGGVYAEESVPLIEPSSESLWLGSSLGSVEAFDPEAEKGEESRGSWQACPPMNGTRYCHAAATCGGAIVVCGGETTGLFTWYTPSESVEYYNPGEAAWQCGPPMLTARMHHSATTMSKKIYVCGGATMSNSVYTMSRSVECFDRSTGNWAWTALPPMHCEREMFSAVTIAGYLYIVGGCYEWNVEGDFPLLDTVERFSPERGDWEIVARGSSPRYFVTACACISD